MVGCSLKELKMNLIPQILMDLAGSKKAITFWVIVALWMPAIHVPLGLSETGLMWCTIGFCAYVLSQGIADHGEAKSSTEGGCKGRKEIK
jgi:hypothetical protein